MSWNNNQFNMSWDMSNYRRQPSYIPGKIVNNESDIVPQDVPLNGQVAFFPSSDYSCIYAKTWSQAGDRVETKKFVPEDSNAQNGQSIEQTLLNSLALLGGQMEELKNELDEIKKSTSRKPYYGKKKPAVKESKKED